MVAITQEVSYINTTLIRKSCDIMKKGKQRKNIHITCIFRIISLWIYQLLFNKNNNCISEQNQNTQVVRIFLLRFMFSLLCVLFHGDITKHIIIIISLSRNIGYIQLS